MSEAPSSEPQPEPPDDDTWTSPGSTEPSERDDEQWTSSGATERLRETPDFDD